MIRLATNNIPTHNQPGLAFACAAKCFRGAEPTDLEWEAAEALDVNPRAHIISIPLAVGTRAKEYRAQSVATDSAGGVLQQALLSDRFIIGLDNPGDGPVRIVSTNEVTETSGTLRVPHVNDTSRVGARIQENTQAATDTDLTLGATNLGAVKYTSLPAAFPHELQREGGRFLPGIFTLLLRAIARAQNADFTTGAGDGWTPQGVVTGSALGVTAALTTAFTADELLELVESVNPSHRLNARWMMHSNVWLACKKLKDGNGRYLWKAAGLDEWPVTINNDMASSIAASEKTISFGDFGMYIVRDVAEARIKFDVESRAEKDQTIAVAFMESDGGLVDPTADAIKYLQQAAS